MLESLKYIPVLQEIGHQKGTEEKKRSGRGNSIVMRVSTNLGRFSPQFDIELKLN
jgi:hypothetical protein